MPSRPDQRTPEHALMRPPPLVPRACPRQTGRDTTALGTRRLLVVKDDYVRTVAVWKYSQSRRIATPLGARPAAHHCVNLTLWPLLWERGPHAPPQLPMHCTTSSQPNRGGDSRSSGAALSVTRYRLWQISGKSAPTASPGARHSVPMAPTSGAGRAAWSLASKLTDSDAA
jgi:hypothetical protein